MKKASSSRPKSDERKDEIDRPKTSHVKINRDHPTPMELLQIVQWFGPLLTSEFEEQRKRLDFSSVEIWKEAIGWAADLYAWAADATRIDPPMYSLKNAKPEITPPLSSQQIQNSLESFWKLLPSDETTMTMEEVLSLSEFKTGGNLQKAFARYGYKYIPDQLIPSNIWEKFKDLRNKENQQKEARKKRNQRLRAKDQKPEAPLDGVSIIKLMKTAFASEIKVFKKEKGIQRQGGLPPISTKFAPPGGS